ncbi:tRNA (uridine(34)/cytosine(34)/5-carboxymethylaminomethyluridine(34)-2'-O)-methyltransferase TrmL [Paenibacillus albicereus]|uniref:Putative tRNA (cytidine(34)-2'-O)-methyltransferase n=1 Tax=Paenibacillus albicereus TaxID=2726185 RepID=A0A6H2H0L5_9BACL|nr:tRNA (uridine(34)/cytosine(34)/5-carboxymethylaminomethyluridine(34)-2'-O)-methyltransferase TrmL [Paenibacillus albicereus]QJC53192.1 tRNA (uridine(34)/cytosine(34)/5-carboxymethylaminomethyluridine(34)-2'-O)-methyltransferase TrmL [Paenibacillus albicereus]
MAFHIVLVEPEIPANTGNIARTCAATGAHLHLVRPLGFQTDDRTLKRAGLDYWHAVRVAYYDSFQEVQERFPHGRFFYASTKASRRYDTVAYRDGDLLVFGKETKGLPPELIEANRESAIRMPMTGEVRSMNLSNSAAVILFEALRQNGFPGMA